MREVRLPDGVGGRLWLAAMPGTVVPFGEDGHVWRRLAIDRVLCLTPWEELAARSPAYLRAIQQNHLPCRWESFPIDDYDVAGDDDLLRIAGEAVAWLRAGELLLIHCGAGVGRTGTVAACILLQLGFDHATAVTRVREVGSEPETVEQEEQVAAIAASIAAGAGRVGGADG